MSFPHLNFINVLKEKIEDYHNWNFGVGKIFLGLTYYYDSGIIGIFKGTVGNGHITPFKKVQDKGTWRNYGSTPLFFYINENKFAAVDSGDHLPWCESGHYTFVDFKTYPFEWIDDTPDVSDSWELQFTDRVDYPSVAFLSPTEYLLFYKRENSSHYWDFVLEKYNRDSLESSTVLGTAFRYSKMAVPDVWDKLNADYDDSNIPEWQKDTTYNVGDLVVPTSEVGYVYKCTTAGTSGDTEPDWNYQGNTDDGTIVWEAHPNWIYFYVAPKGGDEGTKFHIQLATDSDFSNIIYENNPVIKLDDNCNKKNYVVNHSPVHKQALYFRARMENDDGSVVSEWSETIYWSATSDNILQSYKYNPGNNEFSPNYTGTRTQLSHGKATKHLDRIDLIIRKRVQDVSNGDSTDSNYIYFYVYDLSGNLIRTVQWKQCNSDNSEFINSIEKDTVILEQFDNSIIATKFDGSNFTSKTISKQNSSYSFYANITQKIAGKLYIIWSETNWYSTAKIYTFNFNTEEITDITNMIHFAFPGMISSNFGGDGFWYDYEDSQYHGVGFAYTGGPFGFFNFF